MRISTSTLYETSSSKLSELQSALARQQQQIASGRRLLTPADDPVAAARAQDITQSQAINVQFGVNRQNLRDSLSQEESTLGSVTSLLHEVKVLTISAGNASLDDLQRKSIALELQGKFDQMLSLANSRDSVGNFMFAGFQTTSQPFAQIATGASYAGDQGQRFLQVDGAREMALSDSGDSVFEKNKTGNGTFVTAASTVATAASASTVNTGSGIVSSGSVTNSAALTQHNYEVVFSVASGVTTYSVYDMTLDPAEAAPLAASGPYVDGQTIAFDGMQLSVTGSPAHGDHFSIDPSTHQSVFTTLRNLITALNTSASGAVGMAALTNGLNTANNSIGQSLDTVLSIRTSVGSRLNEIESLDYAGSDKDLQYSQTLAQLQDLDYTKAITELTQRQTILTAAQQSFVKISGLSLFNYL